MDSESQDNVIELSRVRENNESDMLEWRNFMSQEIKRCTNIHQLEHEIVKHTLFARAEQDGNQGLFYMLSVLDVIKAIKEANGDYYGIKN